MPSARMSSEGKITIPESVREALGIRAGDRIDFVRMPDGSVVIYAATKSLMRLKGIVPAVDAAVSLESMDAAIGEQFGED
ncbi:MAG: AbrB/MazE/SpoVT family DNA-binding domain-containing protein [Hyphomonas sp.]|uniref:AbrB/MazE/SpoVT family DNA-binding domain-containing protein n=1 Tax=Hyphomonas sp. TaxID=87 RepID=UPI00184CDD3A|nr:AbrB/MazE/SpoVT family DNA-binding domain-containing protein [Hyphomonas sp.]MBU3920648.1 type II toxin-antitoxin system PrlF family antitoxin [Alphaproteobacteria bacterium]MBA3070029.1 AbrB/MazE/SpoVT family DNA-binding domain-containing protein [Hyphomonas sp.]MBU4060395.1 type II toxin-antitoxin system PrlF family antitoxin [Alphaproteobacteria bacterium]MBU4163063.1 type II toxin-antitoxin system PrlF family antitoxin [Alphaproteobacteria bacterium]MBU4569429.1 type II toxin-antitoxin 